jgi:hypothetical protein
MALNARETRQNRRIGSLPGVSVAPARAMERDKKKASEYYGNRPCIDPVAIERIAATGVKRPTFLQWVKRRVTNGVKWH